MALPHGVQSLDRRTAPRRRSLVLDRVAPSPLHTLNRAVALAEWQGAEVGLALLDAIALPEWLESSYLWDAVAADLHRRSGQLEKYVYHRDRAFAAAPSDAVRSLLRRRLVAVAQVEGVGPST